MKHQGILRHSCPTAYYYLVLCVIALLCGQNSCLCGCTLKLLRELLSSKISQSLQKKEVITKPDQSPDPVHSVATGGRAGKRAHGDEDGESV